MDGTKLPFTTTSTSMSLDRAQPHFAAAVNQLIHDNFNLENNNKKILSKMAVHSG